MLLHDGQHVVKDVGLPEFSLSCEKKSYRIPSLLTTPQHLLENAEELW